MFRSILRLFSAISLFFGIYIVFKNTLGLHVLEEYNEYLEGAAFLKIFSVLDFFGSIIVCNKYKDFIISNNHCENPRAISWFESLVVCTIMQFGGTTLTGILLGQTPSWILSKTGWFILTF